MTTLTLDDRGTGLRGVLASYADVTPTRRAEDLIKSKIGLRDVLILLVGAASMWGAQVATQWKIQSSIEATNASVAQLTQKVESYQKEQVDEANALQRQIDENRKQVALAIVNEAATAKELAELKGYLAGAGIKVPKEGLR